MKQQDKRALYIPYAGPTLLEMPLLNKGSAFNGEERVDFNLVGLLPQNVESIEEQVERAYRQYSSASNDLDKHIYLRGIQDDNETMFFRLLEEHLEEMLPIIYTPTVGDACEKFSKIYRNHRGIFVSYPDRHYMDDIIRSATKDNVRVIVVTDGERILGLGDQGIGGMGIPIGKLSLYSACGGISPAYTLPVMLDVGTNNEDLLNDPMYMGWRHERIGVEAYAEFVDLFVQAVKRRWPNVLLQFEDFAQGNAMPLLERYRDQLCCFNDDIQGTAAVCVGSLLAACKAKRESICEQTIVFVGAGSAGCGIAEQIVVAMTNHGMSEDQARARIFLIDREGLLTRDMTGLYDFQAKLAPRQERTQALGRRSGQRCADDRGGKRAAHGPDRRIRRARAVLGARHQAHARTLRASVRHAAVQPHLARGSHARGNPAVDRRPGARRRGAVRSRRSSTTGAPSRSPSATTPIFFPASVWAWWPRVLPR